MVFDPFAAVELVDRESIDEEMYTVPIGSKVFGIDEGLLVGLIIGYLLSLVFQGD